MGYWDTGLKALSQKPPFKPSSEYPNIPISQFPMQRPLIGVQAQKLPDENFYRLNPKYTDAIFAGGGIPIILPLIAAPEYLERVWPLLDGLVLSGCYSDLDPKFYGEAPHPKLGPVSERRDQFDWLLLARAHEERMPIFGICRGFQSLNVFRGGKLIQDLPSQQPSHIDHDPDEDPNKPFAHLVQLAPLTLLNHAKNEAQAQVNSLHHQAVREAGRGLRPIAWAEDGVIEAVQGENLFEHYVLGVQWHPERTHDLDEFSLQLFKDFVQAVIAHTHMKNELSK